MDDAAADDGVGGVEVAQGVAADAGGIGAPERRITAVLLASPRASWREVGRYLGLSERTVVRRAAPLLATIKRTGLIRRSNALKPAAAAGVG